MLLNKDDIYFDYSFKNKTQALKTVGQLLVDKGYVEPKYIKAMIKRDQIASVAIGNGLAIGHGTVNDLHYIKRQGMILVKLNEPLQWDDEQVLFIVGLAINGDQQMDVLQELALSFADFENVEKLYQMKNDQQMILNFLTADDKGDELWKVLD